MVFRFSFLIAAVCSAYLFLIFHMYELQVVKGGEYFARAESEYASSGLFNADRGTIYFTDKNGTGLPAALNKNFSLVYAVPKVIADPAAAAKTLAPILGTAESVLVQKFSKKNDTYELLERKASKSLADSVSALGIKGIYITNEPARFYP